MIVYLPLLIAIVGAFLHVTSGSWKWLGLSMFLCGLFVFLLKFDVSALHVR